MIIYIVEGEKDAENLRKLSLSATTNCGGAGKWNDTYSTIFHSASIVIIADKDVPGRKHAMQAARSLYGKVASLKLLELPDRDGRQVKDASDWLAVGGTREELEQLCNKEKEWSASGGASRLWRQAERNRIIWFILSIWSMYSPKVLNGSGIHICPNLN